MAGKGDDWNSFLQGREARLLLDGLCVVICVFYAVGAVRELMHPEQSVALIEVMGATAYIAMTALRMIVCLATAIAFARMAVKVWHEDDDDE